MTREEIQVRDTGAAEIALRAMARRVKSSVETAQCEFSGDVAYVDRRRYLDEERWKREQAVFAGFPQIAAHVDEVPAMGAMEVTLSGQSLILSRDESGTIRAFINSCRHRGMALLEPGQSQCKKRLNCPYHGWSYALDGELSGMPHAEAFPGIGLGEFPLRSVPCELRHGLVWVQPGLSGADGDIASWLGGIDDDFHSLRMDDLAVFRVARSTVDANWKLCIDAFLEAYHVKVLHRNSVGPFFEDGLAVFDRVQQHFRSGVARKGVDLTDVERVDMRTLRDRISITHFVFPNQIFVFHPDYVSQLSILPTAVDQFDWVHRMLIPCAQNTPERQAHWEASYELIEDGVFQAEDLAAAEAIHRGLQADSEGAIPLGRLEILIRYFHDMVDAELASAESK